jgi:protein TonB
MFGIAAPVDPLAEPPPLARSERLALAFSIAVAASVHVAIGASLPYPPTTTTVQPTTMEVIEVMLPSEPPEPKTDPEPEAPKRSEPPSAAEERPTQPAPNAPAQAAQVLTQSDTEDEPVDLTDSIVTGSATTYAGGTTTTSGTSAKAARGRSSAGEAGGAAAGRATAPANTAIGPDRSRKAGLVGRLDWSCPFPHEADADSIDHAVVGLAVRISATAKVESVSVISDPGHGFGAAARRCAYSKRWQPAIDRAGQPITSSLTLNVRFTR